ncbi:MAG: hypothetical protein AB1710_07270 [Pseudomonadota bacterium]
MPDEVIQREANHGNRAERKKARLGVLHAALDRAVHPGCEGAKFSERIHGDQDTLLKFRLVAPGCQVWQKMPDRERSPV